MNNTIEDLKLALELYEQEQDKELEQKYADLPEHRFSRRFERRMKRMFRNCSRTPQQMRTIGIARKAAAMIAIAVLAAGATIVSADAFRERFIRVIFRGNTAVTDYKFPMRTDKYYDVDLAKTVYGYIPDGYEKTEETYNSARTISRLRFEKDTGASLMINLRVITPDSDASTWADAEITEKTEIKIKGEDALLNYKDGECTLIWWQHNVICRLSGNLGKEEAIRTAENIDICFLGESGSH